MAEQLIEGQEVSIETQAALLRSMADRLILNGPNGFGGCFVIIPPDGAESITTLILDSKQDQAQFFAILKTKAEMALQALDEQARQAGGFRR